MTLVDAFNETFLIAFLDRSNFDILEKKCKFRPGQYGKLKSEISDNVPQVAYFISPKVYSIELRKRVSLETSVDMVGSITEDPTDLSFKRAAKGVDRSQLGTAIDQTVYRNVYEESLECPQIYNCSFRFNPNISAMSTVTSSKIPLTLRDDKRFYLNKDISVAYGHKLSFEHGFETSDIVCVKGGHISWENNDIHSNTLSLDDQEDVDLYNILFELQESDDENESFAHEITDDDGPIISFDNDNLKRKFNPDEMDSHQTKKIKL